MTRPTIIHLLERIRRNATHFPADLYSEIGDVLFELYREEDEGKEDLQGRGVHGRGEGQGAVYSSLQRPTLSSPSDEEPSPQR